MMMMMIIIVNFLGILDYVFLLFIQNLKSYNSWSYHCPLLVKDNSNTIYAVLLLFNQLISY